MQKCATHSIKFGSWVTHRSLLVVQKTHRIRSTQNPWDNDISQKLINVQYHPIDSNEVALKHSIRCINGLRNCTREKMGQSNEDCSDCVFQVIVVYALLPEMNARCQSMIWIAKKLKPNTEHCTKKRIQFCTFKLNVN